MSFYLDDPELRVIPEAFTVMNKMTLSEPNNFYKKKYLICVYDKDDLLVGVYDNHYQFEKEFHELNTKSNSKNENYDSATRTLLSRFFLKKFKTFAFRGQRLHIEFVDMFEEMAS